MFRRFKYPEAAIINIIQHITLPARYAHNEQAICITSTNHCAASLYWIIFTLSFQQHRVIKITVSTLSTRVSSHLLHSPSIKFMTSPRAFTWLDKSHSYTGFPRSCNNVLQRKLISTCAVKIKWPLSMRLQDLLLQEIEVLLFQVLTSSWSSILRAYSNVRPGMNQISRLQFCACANSSLYCCKNEENHIATRDFQDRVIIDACV